MNDTGKKSFFVDSVFATGFILFSIYLLSLIPFNSDIINPVSKALGDFKLTDIVFSHLRTSPQVDNNITMVNIGAVERDRDGLAAIINKLNKYEPKVIGIDAFFRKPRKDSTIDSALVKAFANTKNLVLVSEMIENPNTGIGDSMETSHAMFMKYAQPGFADMITEGKEQFKTARDCSPIEKTKSFYKWVDTTIITEKRDIIGFKKVKKDTVIEVEEWDFDVKIKVKKKATIEEKVYEYGAPYIVKRDTVVYKKVHKDTTFYSFPVKIASIYSPSSVKNLLKNNRDTEIINFSGNIDTRREGVSANSKITFFALDVNQVLNEEFTADRIKDKIVIIGYMGDSIGDNKWEDKFFTPLNYDYIGKAYPDMYGVVVHANIVSMILKGNYIHEMDETLNYLISIVLIFFNVWFFSFLFLRTGEWYDGLSAIITLIEIMVLMIIVLFIFDVYNYKIDITLPSVALFLTGNLVEIHFGLVKPAFFRFSNRVPFLQKIIPIFTIK